MKKLKEFFDKYEDLIISGTLIVAGGALVYAGLYINKQDKIIKGLAIEDVCAKLTDTSLSVRIIHNDGFWHNWEWDVEKLKEAALEAASQKELTA